MEQDKDYLHIGDGDLRFTKFGDTWKHWTGNMEVSRQNLTFLSVHSRLQMIFTSDEAGTRVGFHILLRPVDTMTTDNSVTSGIHNISAGISTTRQDYSSQDKTAEISTTHQDTFSQVFNTTISTTPAQLLIRQDKFFIWFLIALASLLALILMLILLGWLSKKYLKRLINRHFNSVRMLRKTHSY
ncbi:uncharacterized protein [Diadema antillarum]|uniref:uncharacterized protein n=1 Tax=Diadema antillarum TaxID=105358 RepID=UPI003A8AFDA2